MTRKSPYDEYEKYTPETVNIANEFQHALQPVFNKYVAQGYSIRQLSHMVFEEVWELELLAILDTTKEVRAATKAKLPLPRPKRPIPGPGRE